MLPFTWNTFIASFLPSFIPGTNQNESQPNIIKERNKKVDFRLKSDGIKDSYLQTAVVGTGRAPAVRDLGQEAGVGWASESGF